MTFIKITALTMAASQTVWFSSSQVNDALRTRRNAKMSTQDSCQCGHVSRTALTLRFTKRVHMERFVFSCRCDQMVNCAIRFVCLEMC